MVDRAEVNRALAKALAFKGCGKDAEAAVWARRLVVLLECADILVPVESSLVHVGHPPTWPGYIDDRP